jgi:hypothetical protein
MTGIVLQRSFSWFERHPAQAMVVVALLLVLSDGLLLRNQRWYLPNYTGMSWDTAELLTTGQGYSFLDQAYFPFAGPNNKVSAAREPVPVLLFAAAQIIRPGSHLALGVLQAAAHLATMFGIFSLTRRLGNTSAAMLASILWAFYPAALRELIGKEVDLITSAFAVWGVAFFVRAWQGGEIRSWILSAATLGLAVLSRSALLAVVLVVVFGLMIAKVPKRSVVVFVSVFVLTKVPWVVRNALVFGKPVVGTTLAGYNLYRQNCLIEEGNFLRFLAGSESDAKFAALIAAHPELKGTENEAEMDAFYRREALEIIREHPMRYAALSGFRFFILWFNFTVPQAYGRKTDLMDIILMAWHALLLAGGLAAWRKLGNSAWPLMASVGAFTVIHMLVAARMFYVLSVVPLLLAMASIIVLHSAERSSTWAWGVAASTALVFVLDEMMMFGYLALPNS